MQKLNEFLEHYDNEALSAELQELQERYTDLRRIERDTVKYSASKRMLSQIRTELDAVAGRLQRIECELALRERQAVLV
ncbi:hypothetical protein [Canibacter oris]|uniref:Septation ring formation regulator EzrA n=1 Tax=Canibacter oris TaxID=1365628 RepID=A0A840DK22_9MICO|nr:hypothetical protein [Canibacter oris]MBB4072065.1 septation ring formation regulator EzrA [Canibacter oris]